MAPTPPKAAKTIKPTKAEKTEKPVRSRPAAGAVKSKASSSNAAPVSEPAAPASIVKLKDVIGAVAEATGQKKPAAKQSVEATLAALANALAAGATLVIPPLGKLRVAKSQGGMMTLKLRQQGSAGTAAKPLAEDREDD